MLIRPLLNSCRSHVDCAMISGVRGKAIVTPVQSSSRSLCSAASVSERIESCFSSPVVIASKPSASAWRTRSAMPPSHASP